MCGIVGVVARERGSASDWLTAGRDVLIHRGPDDAGVWWSDDRRTGLAHRRLSILDLSAAGHQPMQDARAELTIVFNGEIYNYRQLQRELTARGHRFRSHSDTEVILASYREWGTDCLSRFNGMFAFALHDARTQTVFLARDRAGEKPLFYALGNGSLRFASELKALMADPVFPRRIDPEAMDCYLAFGYVPGDRSILQGVNKLPPAHALTYDLNSGEHRTWRYWQVPDYQGSARQRTEGDLLDELESLLADAVARQLVADVPVGVLLSGGVDSSVVTALTVRAAPHISTFTVRFPGYGNYDETEHARLIARHFGTAHIELDAGEIGPDVLPILARQYDEPMVDSSMIPTYLLTRLVRQHCTVVLGGDGGDELFGGYRHYSRLMWMRQRLGRIPLCLRRLLAGAAEKMLPIGMKGRNWLQGLGVDFRRDLPLIAAYFDRTARRHLMGPAWPFKAEKIRQQRLPPIDDLLGRAMRMDFENYLPEDILVKVDRASMLNSLEVRAPMLDYRVIEFAFGQVPDHLKVTPVSRKILLNRLAARLLPPEFDQQRKQGFCIPLGRWLQGGPWLDFFKSVLLDGGSIFDRKTVAGLFKGQARGRFNAERLTALVLFELWRREYHAEVA